MVRGLLTREPTFRQRLRARVSTAIASRAAKRLEGKKSALYSEYVFSQGEKARLDSYLRRCEESFGRVNAELGGSSRSLLGNADKRRIRALKKQQAEIKAEQSRARTALDRARATVEIYPTINDAEIEHAMRAKSARTPWQIIRFISKRRQGRQI
ncbi:MAG: hypothetical protein NT067_00330 [Candidatus Diapherotrites archaeon]|nr:hypothetical protein [Candidatus Diapherotrites archaeon]